MNRRQALALAGLAITGAAGFKGCSTGRHGGQPVRSQNWWANNPKYLGGYIVFGQRPSGHWEQVGWARRPGRTRVPVWVQKR